jgi:hypothetical protein
MRTYATPPGIKVHNDGKSVVKFILETLLNCTRNGTRFYPKPKRFNNILTKRIGVLSINYHNKKLGYIYMKLKYLWNKNAEFWIPSK